MLGARGVGSLHIWLFSDPTTQTTHNNKATTPPAITAQQQRTAAPVTPQRDQDQDREREGPWGGVPGAERPTPRPEERLLVRLTVPSEAHTFPRTTEMTHAEVTGVKVRAKTKQGKPGAPQGWFSLEQVDQQPATLHLRSRRPHCALYSFQGGSDRPVSQARTLPQPLPPN